MNGSTLHSKAVQRTRYIHMSEAGPSNMDAVARWLGMSRLFIHYSETFCRDVHFCPRLRAALESPAVTS